MNYHSNRYNCYNLVTTFLEKVVTPLFLVWQKLQKAVTTVTTYILNKVYIYINRGEVYTHSTEYSGEVYEKRKKVVTVVTLLVSHRLAGSIRL